MEHIFIFNGGTATGKTKLCSMIPSTYITTQIGLIRATDDSLIVDDFWFYDNSKQDYDREKIRDTLSAIESGEQVKYEQLIIFRNKCIIVCHDSREHINYLIEYIKHYYEVQNKKIPYISYVEFSKV